jgi:transposase
MLKYSRELKITVANEFLSGISSATLSKKYSIPRRQIRYWSQVVEIHGDNAFQPTPHFRNGQAKLEALKLMWANGWSIGHTSAMLNLVSPGILFVWLERYREKGLLGLETQSKGKHPMKPARITLAKDNKEKTIEELREEVAYLRAENAVLKKLEELRQAKQKQTKKKH